MCYSYLMTKKRVYLILILIFLLAFFAFNFSYPNIWNNFAKKFGLPNFWTKPYILGLDLQGGVSLVYEADLSNVEDKARAMAGLRDVIERRVNLFGVTEPVVRIQGQNRLIVELAGVKDVQSAIKMIGETPYLEFLEQRPEEETQKILDKIKEVQEAQNQNKDITKIKDWQIALQNPYFKPTELTGKYLKKSQISFDQNTLKPEIQLQFNDEGAKIFEQITERNIKKPLAIFLDGASIVDTNSDGKIDANDLYAPIVQDKISGGKAVIKGEMDVKKAQEIVRRLNFGALPVKIGEPISQQTVGPTLGAVSVQKSLIAGVWGFLGVVLFMLTIYRFPGLIASLALLIYISLTLSLFKLIPVTLTLAGIGGFILSIGMAVDANILIFARMREEIKQGKGISLAIEEGFRRAWPSIRDSNFNSLIVCAILFWFATSFIKGFALTLGLGILVSMFSAIFVTRILLLAFVGQRMEKFKWLL